MSGWFVYFLRRAVLQRKGRFLISASAVMLTVAVITALVTLSLGVRDKIGTELRQYGANMVVTDSSGGEIEGPVANAVRGMPGHIKDASFQIYGTSRMKGNEIEVMGVETGKMTGYRIYGTVPRAPHEVMAGVNLRDSLGLRPGEILRFDETMAEFKVTAVFEKGSDEDSMIVMPIEGAREIVGVRGVSSILLNADTRRLKDVEDAIRRMYPFLEVKTLGQVAVAEERTLGKVRILMLLVSGVVLFSSVITLGSTMTANVLDRMEEIGTLKSLGATRGDIWRFFLSEAALSGFAGAFAGYLTGVIAAEGVSKTAFGTFVTVNPLVFPVSLFLGISVSLISTFLPVMDAARVVPARILRGE